MLIVHAIPSRELPYISDTFNGTRFQFKSEFSISPMNEKG